MRSSILLGLLLAGCVVPPDTHLNLSSMDTPPEWGADHVWSFKVKARKKSGGGDLTLRLTTEERSNPCEAGKWFRAEVVSTTIAWPPLRLWNGSPRTETPIYITYGREFRILLNPGLCDYEVEMRGTVDSMTARGESPLGTFTASVVE
jgi:hypothetical protein